MPGSVDRVALLNRAQNRAMSEMTSTGQPAGVRVAFAPHRANAWLLRLLARPFLRIDGDERPGSWRRDLTVQLPAGHHVLGTFVRYKASSPDLGTGRVRADLHAGEDVHVRAENGWANHTPFTPTLQRGG